MNSPFGLLHQIISETGWTLHYILWRVPWCVILLMLADKPTMRKRSEIIKKGTKDNLKAIIKRTNGQS